MVVTSKVLSKCEGRIVPAPADPEERDTLRRKLIDQEAVRVLARKGRTLITENNLGLIQAAAGVDGSNVGSTELALLPVDPDGSAAALRAGLRDRLGVTVGIVVTDTMGRAWRNGQIDAAIGAAGLTVLHGYAGAHDIHGNELVVTEVAVADEIAAAADLVKGKLTGIPVAVVRGLTLHDDGSNARTLLRPGEEDLFWLGTEEALAMGRGQAQLLRRSVRRFSAEPVAPELIEAAVAEALTAPAPHHTRPVRFVWMADATAKIALLDRMKDKWRSDLGGDGKAPDAVERRVGRGQILYDAPELVIPFMVPDGAHSYPDAARTAAEHTMFTVAVGAAVQALLVALAVRGVGSCWIGSTIFAADLVRSELDLPDDWEPLGAIAIGYPAEPSGTARAGIDRGPAGAQVTLRASSTIEALTAWAPPDPAQDALRYAVLSFVLAREDACTTRMRARPHHRLGAGARPHRDAGPAHPASAVRPLAAARRALRGRRPRHRRCRAAGSDRGVRHCRADDRPGHRRDARASGHLLAGVPTRHLDLQFIAHAPDERRNRLQRRVIGPALVAARRTARRHRLRAGTAGGRSACAAVRRRSSSGCRRREWPPLATPARRAAARTARRCRRRRRSPRRESARAGRCGAPKPMIDRSITDPASTRTPSKITAPSSRAPGPISAPRPTTVPPISSAPGATAAPSCTSYSPRWPPQRRRRRDAANQIGRAADEVLRRAHVAPVRGVDVSAHLAYRRPAAPGTPRAPPTPRRPFGMRVDHRRA